MTIIVNILNTPIPWPTQGDINYSNGTTRFAQLTADALAPIKGLYNTVTGQVGNLSYDNLGQLNLNGSPVISGVSSFNLRTGAITLLSSDVTTALGFTPMNAASPYVTSVQASGGTTGLIFSGGPITSSGTVTMGGVLNLASGGTNGNTAQQARTNLLPAQAGSATKILGTDGTDVSWIPNVGAQGGTNNPIIFENDITVTANYTITAGKNGVSAGPLTVNSGVSVTVPSGSVWSIV